MIELVQCYIIQSDIDMLNKIKSLLLDFEVTRYDDCYETYRDLCRFIKDLEESDII